jgi:diacylglycerol kinase family enzyme
MTEVIYKTKNKIKKTIKLMILLGKGVLQMQEQPLVITKNSNSKNIHVESKKGFRYKLDGFYLQI